MPNVALAILVSGEALFVSAYLVSRFGLFIDHLDTTAEPVVTATFVVLGLFPMALGALLVLGGLLLVLFAKVRTQSNRRLRLGAVPVGIAILSLAASKLLELSLAR